MTSATEVTLAFLKRHPDSAARVLTSMTANDAAAFLSAIPTRYAVSVLVAMNARLSAPLVRHMDETAATAVIRDMEFGAATAILRQLGQGDRQKYMADLPLARRREFKSSLAFAPDLIGSRMTTDIPIVAALDSVDDGLRLLKGASDSSFDSVFVVDDKRQYAGVVHVLALVRSPGATPLGELADVSCPAVSPNMRLEQAAELSGWQEHRMLPIVTRRGELIGAIDRNSLNHPESAEFRLSGNGRQSTGDLMLGAMLDCSAGMLHLLAEPSHPNKAHGGSDGG